MTAAVLSENAGREIRAVRIFEAPRVLVWSAWTELEHIGRWFGPNGFTTTTKDFELKPGGQWNFTMHGPDGVDYRNEIVFTKIVPPERLEYKHGPSPLFSTTITFEEEAAGKTRLTMTTLFATPEERDRVVEKFGAIEGMNQTLGRLADHLAGA